MYVVMFDADILGSSLHRDTRVRSCVPFHVCLCVRACVWLTSLANDSTNKNHFHSLVNFKLN